MEEKKKATTVPVDNSLQTHQQSLKDRIMASIMNSPDDEDFGDKGKGYITTLVYLKIFNLKTFADCLAKVHSTIHVFALEASNMFIRIASYFNGSNTAKRMFANFAIINSHFAHSIGPICQNDCQFGICFEVLDYITLFTNINMLKVFS